MVSEAQKKATKRYHEKLRKYIISCNRKDDADVIRHLDSVSNKTAYIKELVRRDTNG